MIRFIVFVLSRPTRRRFVKTQVWCYKSDCQQSPYGTRKYSAVVRLSSLLDVVDYSVEAYILYTVLLQRCLKVAYLPEPLVHHQQFRQPCRAAAKTVVAVTATVSTRSELPEINQLITERRMHCRRRRTCQLVMFSRPQRTCFLVLFQVKND